MCKIEDFVIFIFLILCSVSDIYCKKIPTVLLQIMSVVILAFGVLLKKPDMLELLGGIAIGILFFVISKYTGEAIGYGDSWLISLMGIYLGGIHLLEVIATAFFLAGVVSFVGMIWKHWKRTVTIPFVPFLTIAYLGVSAV